MVLVDCRVCQKQVAKEARKCPGCGVKTPHVTSFKMKLILEILGYAVISMGMVFMAFNTETIRDGDLIGIGWTAFVVILGLIGIGVAIKRLIDS